ncbi:MAG: hypothetical protein EP330_13380 [Deltaproteobacteria bacterium]|nr:MAG: hypothetical protein EP330_13380 [Deltaproteobacteria bacterium]
MVGGSLLAAQVWWALPFVADDALISLRYSRRLLDGHGLSFTDGEWVEGYSNLLLVLLAAALGATGLDLITAARVVCVAGAAVAVLAAAWWGASRGTAAAVAGGAIAGATLSLGHWAVGGLEQPLLAGLLAAGLAAMLTADEREELRGWALGGVFLALACLTRPDAPLFAVLAAAWAAWRGWRPMLAVSGPAAVAVLGQLAFRLATYGEWVPNTAHAKLAISWHRVELGLGYLAEGGPGLAVLGLLAGVGAWRIGARRSALLLGLAGAWLAYVAFIGGDIFPARRHLLAACVPLWFLAAEAFAGNASWLVAAAVGAALVHGGAQETLDDAYRRGRLEGWEWECGVIAGAVGEAFREEQPLVAVNAAGCWPYFSGLPSLDMLGLNDAHIARHPSAKRGQGHLGHELGDGAYVLSREPDMVLFGIWSGSREPGYVGDRELAALPAFQRDYRLVRFASEGRSALVYVRTTSSRIGPVRTADRIDLPVHLAGSDSHRVVLVDGAAATHIPAGQRAQLGVTVPQGKWRAQLRGQGRARISLSGGRLVDGATLAFDREGRLRLAVIADTDFALTELWLTRVP